MSPIQIIESGNLATRYTYRLDSRTGGYGVQVYHCEGLGSGVRPDLRRTKHFRTEEEARLYIASLRMELPQ